MSRHTFFCVDAHTAGNPVRVVVGGAPPLTGATMSDRRQHFIRDYDWIRTGLMFEPRGHDVMSGSVLYAPIRDDTDAAIVFTRDLFSSLKDQRQRTRVLNEKIPTAQLSNGYGMSESMGAGTLLSGARYVTHRAGCPPEITGVAVSLACGTGLLALKTAASLREARFALIEIDRLRRQAPASPSAPVWPPRFEPEELSTEQWLAKHAPPK